MMYEKFLLVFSFLSSSVFCLSEVILLKSLVANKIVVKPKSQQIPKFN